MSTWASRKTNQFGLTDRQTQAVSALVRLGCDKLVAREFGVSVKTVSTLIRGAQRAMGVRTRIHMAVKWDRRMQEIGAQVPSSVFDMGRAHAVQE
jgi:DNA-binding NarL/FixJ family response regulator